ncbi:hypothetical protein AB0L50_38050, partial [Streptomyces flaveolus]|uniref:hypothetical protein n=1 Tax=Streptomyces flaveolus TaxID=67297 RepID=UPI003439F101
MGVFAERWPGCPVSFSCKRQARTDRLAHLGEELLPTWVRGVGRMGDADIDAGSGQRVDALP